MRGWSGDGERGGSLVAFQITTGSRSTALTAHPRPSTARHILVSTDWGATLSLALAVVRTNGQELQGHSGRGRR